MEHKIGEAYIQIMPIGLDEVLEKMNRLVELLNEAARLADSFPKIELLSDGEITVNGSTEKLLIPE
ncbi:hypothetical protein LQZ18_15565 [Lachnospiraceae bacterium ZAX-1]